MKTFLSVLLATLLAACASTHLDVAHNDAADPNAAGAPLPPASRALSSDFEPALSSGAAESKTTWTCPMHPEIKRSEPGKCPICGMNLVPAKQPEAASGAGHEHAGHEHGEPGHQH